MVDAKNYVLAAELYLNDARNLMKNGGHPASIIAQCWLSVAECAKALLVRKGQTKIYDHNKRDGELLAKLYPEQTEMLGIYNDIRRVHRDTYDSPLHLTNRDAELVLEDAEKMLKLVKELLI